jgi:hypothetical protein
MAHVVMIRDVCSAGMEPSDPVILSEAKDLKLRKTAPVGSLPVAEILRRLRGSG